MKFYKYIAVDFDGTLCTHVFPEIGVIENKHLDIINFLRIQKLAGAIIILWTCREDTSNRKYLTEAYQWCIKNNIPIDYVNENPDQEKNGFWKTRKVHANLYIDDMAINMRDIIDIL